MAAESLAATVIVGTGIKMYSSIAKGAAQRDASQVQADSYRLQASEALKSAASTNQETQDSYYQAAGQQITAFGGNDSSLMAIERAAQKATQMQMETLRKAQVNASQYLASAAQAEKTGSSEYTAGILGAVGDGLGTAALAYKYVNPNQLGSAATVGASQNTSGNIFGVGKGLFS